jgi:hypothetical protein
MIVVRNVFQLKFGMAKEAKAKIKEGLDIVVKMGVKDNRACLDVTGPFYTLVLENTFENLGAFEKGLTKLGKDKAWQKWYASFGELVESGHREIYTVVE